MGTLTKPSVKKHATRYAIVMLAALVTAGSAFAWWDPNWTVRKKFTVDTTAEGGNITDPIGQSTVLIRLHDGNFQFASALEEGVDIRFVSADDKTLLPYHIEKYDSLMNEAFVWVKVPDVKPGAKTDFWIYYGNAGTKVEAVADAKASYDKDTAAVYHFGEQNATPVDATANANNATTAGIASEGSMIGGGLRLAPSTSISIPASASLNWPAGGAFTWSGWIKPAVLTANAAIFSQREGGNAIVIGLDNGSPFVEITDASGVQRSAAGAPIAANSWHNLTVVAEAGKTTVYLDGEVYGSVAVGMPAIGGTPLIGADPAFGEGTGFSGEIDEVEISHAARPPGFVKLEAYNQGSEKAEKVLVGAEDESHEGGHNVLTEHLSLISEISKSLTIDGWVVIILCFILAFVGWVVSIQKFLYLQKIQKGSDEFLKQWKSVSTDLTQIDHSDEESIKTLGGTASKKVQRLMLQSPIYHIYHIGSEEIRHRRNATREGGFKGLSARSIQAIRASLDGGLVRETQKLHSNLVFLTIGIAGGPYLGLLGTVIGVMITFAVIAKTGEVEVNSIAPGIAGALLATVAGLAVAIPALFAYSYISSRIKEAINTMHIFIDEFVTKMAEFYPSGE